MTCAGLATRSRADIDLAADLVPARPDRRLKLKYKESKLSAVAGKSLGAVVVDLLTL